MTGAVMAVLIVMQSPVTQLDRDTRDPMPAQQCRALQGLFTEFKSAKAVRIECAALGDPA